jgi:pimeloyl-ACP methyl ester carboxylesterase
LRVGAPPDMEAMGRAAERLMRFVDAALERYPIDRGKLIVMGFSQGGVMAYNLAIRHAERICGELLIPDTNQRIIPRLSAKAHIVSRSIPERIHPRALRPITNLLKKR